MVLIILILRLLFVFFTKTVSAILISVIVTIVVCTIKLIFLRNPCACGNTFMIYTSNIQPQVTGLDPRHSGLLLYCGIPCPTLQSQLILFQLLKKGLDDLILLIVFLLSY